MDTQPEPQAPRAAGIVLFAGAFLTTWTAWAVFLVHHPLPPQDWPIRLLARLILFLVPTLLYVRFALRERPLHDLRLAVLPRQSLSALNSDDHARLQNNTPRRGKAEMYSSERRPGYPDERLSHHPVRGILFGLAAGLIPLGELLWRSLQAHTLPKMPHSADIWLNVILAAPLTEEILFRGLLFRELSRVTTPIQGAVYSSLLFAALHFPYWYLSGAKSAQDLATSMPLIFAIGMLCCALTQISRTLLAPMIFHFLNNLAWSCTL